jgi:hypothetical protein
MRNNRTSHQSDTGLRDGAISLALGIVSMILSLSVILYWAVGPWLRMLLAPPPLSIIGLFFGVIGLKSTGKGKYLAVVGIVTSLFALFSSLILLFTGGWYYISTDYRFW